MVGVFKKDEFSGDFVDGWKTTLKDSNSTQVGWIMDASVLNLNIIDLKCEL